MDKALESLVPYIEAKDQDIRQSKFDSAAAWFFVSKLFRALDAFIVYRIFSKIRCRCRRLRAFIIIDIIGHVVSYKSGQSSSNLDWPCFKA